jgi:hypothetical protein
MSETNIVSPLRQHMIEDMAARKLNPHTQRSHIQSCKRFAAWLKRSPDTAMPDEVCRFLPWRFLDTGQLSLPSVSSLPASKNQNRSGPSARLRFIVKSASINDRRR